MSRPATSLLVGLSLMLAACSKDGLAPPASLPETVTVTSGLRPDISWAPGNPVAYITVAEAGPGPIVWSVLGQLQANAIRPSVTYGTTPPGAVSTANILLPLAAGRAYTVELRRVDADGVRRLVGAATFRP